MPRSESQLTERGRRIVDMAHTNAPYTKQAKKGTRQGYTGTTLLTMYGHKYHNHSAWQADW